MNKDSNNENIYKEAFHEIKLNDDIQRKIRNRYFKRKKMQLSRWAVAVIIILFICSTTSVVAITKYFSFKKLFSSENESLYEIEVEIEKVNYKDFRGGIEEVKDIILNQQKNYKPYMNSNPLEYTKYFDSIRECMEYVGIEVKYFSIEKDVPVTLKVLCNGSGNIIQTIVMSDYKLGGNNVQIWYYIFSDLKENPYEEIMNGVENGELMEEGFITFLKDKDSIVFESAVSEKNEYQINTEILSNKKRVPIILSKTNSNNIVTAESYFSQNMIVYSINVSSNIHNDESAEKTLQEILRLFY